jgi:hypothetical protein
MIAQGNFCLSGLQSSFNGWRCFGYWWGAS